MLEQVLQSPIIRYEFVLKIAFVPLKLKERKIVNPHNECLFLPKTKHKAKLFLPLQLVSLVLVVLQKI